MSAAAIFFLVLGTIMMLLIIFLLGWLARQKRVATDTQRIISDRDLLLLVNQQPDGMIHPGLLAEKTGLSKSEARSRLSQLATFGALTTHYATDLKPYYSLTHPIDERPTPSLSPEPFLTVEDWLVLFRHHDFRFTPQDLIMATGLPLLILKREIKYFNKQKVIRMLTHSSTYGQNTAGRSYILREPYRSDPDRFLADKLELDQQMEKILRKEDLV